MNSGKDLLVSLLTHGLSSKKQIGQYNPICKNIYISSNVKILEAAHMNMMHMGIEPTSSDVTNQKTVGLTIKKVRCKKEQLECN